MELEIPGQLKGPECRRVITQAVELRRELEAALRDVDGGPCTKLSLLLRVGGSLGSFGETIHDPTLKRGLAICEIEIPDADWAQRSDAEIRDVVAKRLLEGLEKCAASSVVPSVVLEAGRRALANS